MTRQTDLWISALLASAASSAAHSSLKPLQIGPERTALLHQTNDVNGAVETRQASVIFGVGNNLAVRFRAATRMARITCFPPHRMSAGRWRKELSRPKADQPGGAHVISVAALH